MGSDFVIVVWFMGFDGFQGGILCLMGMRLVPVTISCLNCLLHWSDWFVDFSGAVII